MSYTNLTSKPLATKTNNPPKTMFSRLTDSKGETLSIGDEVLMANPSRFGDTTFNKLVVTGRTPGMIRVMSYTLDVQGITDYAATHRRSPRHKGAIVSPWNTYRLGVSKYTEKEIVKAIEAGVSVAVDDGDEDISPFSL